MVVSSVSEHFGIDFALRLCAVTRADHCVLVDEGVELGHDSRAQFHVNRGQVFGQVFGQMRQAGGARDGDDVLTSVQQPGQRKLGRGANYPCLLYTSPSPRD